MAIRVLRLLEYTFRDPQTADEHQQRWTNNISNSKMTMKSAVIPFEAIEWKEDEE